MAPTKATELELERELKLEQLVSEQLLTNVGFQPKKIPCKGYQFQSISGDIFIWIQQVDANTEQTLETTIKSCTEFLLASGEHNNQQAWAFAVKAFYPASTTKTFVLVAEIIYPPEKSLELEAERLLALPGPPWSWLDQLSPYTKYVPLKPHSTYDRELGHSCQRKPKFCLCAVYFAAFCALVLLASMLALNLPGPSVAVSHWPEDGYIRYPTPGSDGPKRQGRIYFHNASEWSLNNPHNHGEWRIRLDDQALVPAAAWDDEEDRFQQWYHSRYPELSEVIRTNKFIRPSWLGSPKILVKWDKEYHFAHCVLSLRRYWKAKETGRHVCPRDIAYNHIQHCINWFERVAFTEGAEATIPEMGDTMIWQTKVCF